MWPQVPHGMSSATHASRTCLHLLQGTVMRLLEDLLVCIPTRAARWSQNIQDGSQELQSRAGAPRRRVLQELVVSQHVGTQPGPGREALEAPQGGWLLQDLAPLAPSPTSPPRRPSPPSSSLAGQFLQRPGSPQVQGKAQLAFPYQLLKQGGPLGLVERLSLGLLTREAPKENGAMETGGEHWPSCPSTHRLQEVNILELEKSRKNEKAGVKPSAQ